MVRCNEIALHYSGLRDFSISAYIGCDKMVLPICVIHWQCQINGSAWKPLKSSRKASIKTHGSVSCGPRKQDAPKRSEHIDRKNKAAIFISSIISDLNSTKFTTEVPSTQGWPYFKFKENFFHHSRGNFWKNFLVFSCFCTLCKIAITHICMLQSG